MAEVLSELTNPKCPCGKPAKYVCECGCLCCGEDPCQFGCGGSVTLIGEHSKPLEVRR